MTDDTTLSASQPAPGSEPCACPVLRGFGRTGNPTSLPNHTLACLRARRGDRTLAEYYGPPAKPARPRPERLAVLVPVTPRMAEDLRG